MLKNTYSSLLRTHLRFVPMASQTSPVVLRGGCCCGAVQYSATKLPTDITNCHCVMCRRLSGSAFMAFADFPATSVHFESRETLQTLYLSDVAERAYCGACGTPVSMMYKCDPDAIGIAAGTIDEDSVIGELEKAKTHIFLSQKASWYAVPEDGLERYERFSEEFQQLLDKWTKTQLENSPSKTPGNQ